MDDSEKAKLIAEMQKVAQSLGADSVPRHEFLRAAGVSERKVARLFGSYNGLVVAAGLKPLRFPPRDQPVYSDDEILDELLRVLRQPSSKLTRLFFEQNSDISASACERRFGGWIGALRTLAGRLNRDHDHALLARIEDYTSQYIGPEKQVSGDTRTSFDPKDEAIETDDEATAIMHPALPFTSSNVYGDFINFRGLQHAPVNEQGVVFLFGMVCRELGYVVESVKQGFPDCEAKRRLGGKAAQWQRVRIEFEYQSRSFRAHGHDPDLCDVIVCWEDNWPDCPLEVLELRSVLSRLTSDFQSQSKAGSANNCMKSDE